MKPVLRRIIKALAALAAVGMVYALIELPTAAQLAVQTSAKWACQCRYIDGGEDAFCITEDPLGLGVTTFIFEPGAQRVRVKMLALFKAQATYVPERGCRVTGQ